MLLDSKKYPRFLCLPVGKINGSALPTFRPFRLKFPPCAFLTWKPSEVQQIDWAPEEAGKNVRKCSRTSRSIRRDHKTSSERPIHSNLGDTGKPLVLSERLTRCVSCIINAIVNKEIDGWWALSRAPEVSARSNIS